MHVEEHVDCGVSVDVVESPQVVVVDGLHVFREDLFGESGFATPVLLARGTASQVGLGEVCGLALWRAVPYCLHPSELQAIVVCAPGSSGVVRENRRKINEQGQRNDIEIQE